VKSQRSLNGRACRRDSGCGWQGGGERVAHGLVFPEPECWEARERGDLEHLTPQCFIRTAERP